MNLKLVLCHCPSLEAAQRLARQLVEERLAACINCVPGSYSIYRWQGHIEEQSETLLLIKTTAVCMDALKLRIQELHDYELPEIIAVDVAEGLDRYLSWVQSETQHP
jgi:periplasmic divalent cation tolerance protein